MSRRHCLLDIDPPFVGVRDLSSLNGTYVNGRNIGQREKRTPLGEIELHDGDRLIVGNSQFLIEVRDSLAAEAFDSSQVAEANRVEPRYALCE